MIFQIRQGATLPNLVMELREDGFHQFNSFTQKLQNSEILFHMKENDSCIPVVQCGECCLVEEPNCSGCPSNFFIMYKWQSGDTDKKGFYTGEFEITDVDTGEKFIGPIRQNLQIKIF